MSVTGNPCEELMILMRTFSFLLVFFVASANERIADGARRLIANELEGDELRAGYRTIERLAVFLPIATIAAKTRIAERIAEGDLRFLTE